MINRLTKVALALVLTLLSTSLKAQWNNTGDNSTTGTLYVGALHATGIADGYNGGLLQLKNNATGNLWQFTIRSVDKDKFQLYRFNAAANSWLNTLTMTMEGKVGLGSSAPENLLHLNTSSSLDGIKLSHLGDRFALLYTPSMSSGAWNPVSRANDAGIIYGRGGADNLDFGFVIAPWSNRGGGIRIDNQGNVGIGTGNTDPLAKLTVAGNVHAREVKVTVSAGADFVFEEDYKLPSLQETANYIKEHKHLPGIAPAAEMEAGGLDIGKMNILLLQKVEELTLHLIDLEKKVSALQKENAKLKKK